MIKKKPKKALVKRTRVNKNNVWKRKSAKTSHLFDAKTTKSKRHAKKGRRISSSDMSRPSLIHRSNLVRNNLSSEEESRW